MEIRVPQLPPKEYNPNWRGHWAARHRAGRIYLSAVFYSCIDLRSQLALNFKPLEKARIDLTFVCAQVRRRDRDNLIARFKPGLDAIVSAGLLADDSLEHLTIGEVNVEIDKDRAPLTIIQLREEMF